jgi:hypothetical protein
VGGEVIARIPRDVLDEYNVITFTAVQHYTVECEDPFDPNLWSRISNKSFLRIPHKRKQVKADLSQFPSPFFNTNGLGPVRVSLVAPSTVPEPSIQALGVLGLAFGRISDYRGLEVTETVGSVREATGHSVLVGVYGQHPEIAELVSAQGLEGDSGLIAMAPNPADPSLAVLVVTGKTEAGLMTAAHAVGGGVRAELLSGPRTIVPSVTEGYPESTRKPKPAPAASLFQLSNMDYDDMTVNGFYSDPVVIPLNLEGDAQVRPEGASMQLHYAYSAQLDTRLSTVEVAVDGVNLASRPLDNPSGDQDAILDVDLPEDLVQPDSIVKVQFHLFPKEFDACERVSDRIIWGSVLATTNFRIERDYYANMPDLGRLAYDLWPFTMEGDKGRVTIIAPDAPTRQDAAAVFAVSSALGWKRTAKAPQFRATTGNAVGSALPTDNLIILHSGGTNSAYQGLANTSALRLTDSSKGGKLLTDDANVLIDARQTSSFGSIEQVQHPQSPDKSILVLRANRPEQIEDLASVLLDDEVLDGIEDANIAIVPQDLDEAEVATARLGKTRQVGERPLNTRVTQGLAKFWPAFFLLLLGAALLCVLSVSLWARRNGAHT